MSEWAWDPRVGDAVETDNPALTAALLAVQLGMPIDWSFVADRADYCEEEVEAWA